MPEQSETNGSHENTGRGADVGEMHARRELMEDGRRYIVYYTFGDDERGEGEDV